jgi:hypothetical protein
MPRSQEGPQRWPSTSPRTARITAGSGSFGAVQKRSHCVSSQSGEAPIQSWNITMLLRQMCFMAGRAVAEGNTLGCAEFWFNRYQTFVAALIAFAVALFAALPVFRQLQELKRQSATQRFESLRVLMEVIGEERRLTDEAGLAAGAARIFEESVAAGQVQQPRDLNWWLRHHLRERIEALQKLQNEFSAAGARIWGPGVAARDRLVLRHHLAGLLGATFRLQGQLAAMLSRTPPGTPHATPQWFADLQRPRHISLGTEANALRDAAAAYAAHTDADYTLLEQRLMNAMREFASR